MIHAATRVAAVIGDPVVHSLSPAIHNAAFDSLGLDWVYVALPVPAGSGGAAVDAMRVLGLAGMSVTMPHKAEVVPAADEVSDVAGALGAANCLVSLPDGRIRAENTDGAGFLAGLAADAAIDVAGLTVAVLGAGGAGRAVIQACGAAGAASVLVVNRSGDRARVAAELAGPAGRVAEPAMLGSADLVINATPLGMGADRSLPCDPGLLHRGQVVVDLIYDPTETPWLHELRGAGVEVHNGLSMLVHQAAVAFGHWTEMTAPIDVMRRAAENNLP